MADNIIAKSSDKPDKKHGSMANTAKIYVKSVTGFFQRLRSVTLWILFILYFATSWLTWDGRQAVLFDLPERKFHIFGITFWPQDFVLLSLLLIVAAFTLFTVTTLAGRIWCGYVCPQTSWTFIYIWLEERIEGPRNKRIKLDKAPMSANKFFKKFIKHFLWGFIAFATGFTFVSYFYPVRELLADLGSGNVSPWALFWIGFFTVSTYSAAGFLREQLCFFMCPYARFQAVMFDMDTLIVSYNEKRGEGKKGRGKRKKGEDYQSKGLGDCIDCQQCVQVCPTGIDIRDGLQYQCIACALCVDACNEIMEKMDYEPNLISYTTEQTLDGDKTKFFRPRFFVYVICTMVMISAFFYTLAARDPIELDIIRDRTALYKESTDGRIQNNYSLIIMNKSQNDVVYQIGVTGIKGMELGHMEPLSLKAGEVKTVPVVIFVPPEKLSVSNSKIVFSVNDSTAGIEVDEESRFIGPRKKR